MDNAHFIVLFGIFKIVYVHGVYKSVYLCSQTTQLFLVFFLLFRNLSIRRGIFLPRKKPIF